MHDRETPPATAHRRRGRRPADADARRHIVENALRELTEARVPFTMSDLADRAGISRATLYRDANLRDLVGSTGDGPPVRPVNARDYEKLEAHSAALAKERRSLRRQVRDLEKRVMDAEARADELEAENIRRERANRRAGAVEGEAAEKIRTDAFADGFAAGARAQGQRTGGTGRAGNASADLLSVAARLPRPALIAARRTLARVLHPDLYAQDPAASLLATELLKQINALAGPTR